MYSRVHVHVRLGQSGLEKIDKIADDANANRSIVIRAALKVALAHETELLNAVNATKEQM